MGWVVTLFDHRLPWGHSWATLTSFFLFLHPRSACPEHGKPGSVSHVVCSKHISLVCRQGGNTQMPRAAVPPGCGLSELPKDCLVLHCTLPSPHHSHQQQRCGS